MIKQHIDNIDPNSYCMDTGLDFGKDIGQEMLDAVLSDITQFPARVNYDRNFDPKKLTKEIGAKKTRELIRRQCQVRDNNPGSTMINFTQHFFNDYFKSKLIAAVPDWLKISASEPDCMLQVSNSGDFLPVHKGHHRSCSLFMLLQSDNQETRWYRQKEDFEVIDFLRIPDLDKIELAVSAVIEPGRWYLFSNREWHSVHKFASSRSRISISLDFSSISSKELGELIKSHAV